MKSVVQNIWRLCSDNMSIFLQNIMHIYSSLFQMNSVFSFFHWFSSYVIRVYLQFQIISLKIEPIKTDDQYPDNEIWPPKYNFPRICFSRTPFSVFPRLSAERSGRDPLTNFLVFSFDYYPQTWTFHGDRVEKVGSELVELGDGR